ncbi:type VI secretion system baseplate subunit TssF [Trinickia dabaoshanensis]|uniref:Type VI secretion system baseplate subunit TssF n=1 Tax=Trinickia dabaoshanensis TaxID=564714 RepID=A0A2N7VCX5_9BURK|nr:type VI secretion system baseplate subunit TssF [Trinickia dabaoshanensis]PMS14944.1 type VI secretion system baseplate subunit TssF [Trinickia dabaoshanensis]
MEELLPYYERELSHLRHYSGDFARRFPKIAGHLLPADEHSDDPYVEQLVQAIAMLDARIGKKLKDDYLHGVEALLDVMHPHYLRPFPGCSIAQFSVATATGGKPNIHKLARGTELVSRSINGVQCRFKTAYDVTLAPLKVSEACYVPAAAAPVVLPVNAAGIVSVTFESTAPHLDLRPLGLRTVRTHLNGEPSFIAALSDGLFIHALTSYVEADGDGRWKPLRSVPVTQAGFDKNDALLDYPWKSHPAYRPLAEYFGFPEKHDFADIDLNAILDAAGACRRVTLHVALKEAHGNPHAARLLDSLSATHFRLFSTPVINLFRRPGEPIRVAHREVAYPVVADASRAASYDIYSIDSVQLVRQTQERDRVIEFRPIFSQRHGDDPRSVRYWFARRDPAVALASPGYDTEISVIDTDFDPMASQTDTLSLELTCTNRDLPARLAIGLDGGDLFLRGSDDCGGLSIGAAMLRRPTPTLRFDRTDALRLRLATHLALDHLSLADMTIEALKAALVLYDLRRTAVSSRHIEGIVDVEARTPGVRLVVVSFES